MPLLLDKKGLTEEEFLRQYDPNKYPKPAVTADVAAFRTGDAGPEVLLIRRGGHPFLGRWALPGGFSMRNETLEATAARELKEETGVSETSLTLVGVYSAPDRDPRGWTVSAAYAVQLPREAAVSAGDDAAAARWVCLKPGADGVWRPDPSDPAFAPDERGRQLAFDHDAILADAAKAIGL